MASLTRTATYLIHRGTAATTAERDAYQTRKKDRNNEGLVSDEPLTRSL
jgi:hypothetical protein